VRWTAVVNPRAGRRRRTRVLARLGDALAARGVDIHVTRDSDEGRVAARRAFERGEGVLACGGDGTVRVLADLAAEVDGLLAVVPTGAGNDFARALGLDHRRPLDALDLLDTGNETRVDLGCVRTRDGEGVRFTTVAHSGLDGEVNRWANTISWASGTWLYALAALRTMAVYRPTEMRITVDGNVWDGRPWLVAVANSYCYGGGMRIAPRARLDDGRLDVIVVADVGRAELVARFPTVLRGTHIGIPGVHSLAGKVVSVEGPAAQEVYASGERVGRLPATIVVCPGALRVLVPRGGPRVDAEATVS
jgi:YegS/Rv2252/BmrU family lipid kinase